MGEEITIIHLADFRDPVLEIALRLSWRNGTVCGNATVVGTILIRGKKLLISQHAISQKLGGASKTAHTSILF